MMILVASPLTENIYRRIGAEELAIYFNIVVADCLGWLVRSDRHPQYIEMKSTSICKVGSQKAFTTLIRDVVPDFVLDFVGRGQYTRLFQAQCSKFNARYITHHLVPVPTGVSTTSPWSSLFFSPVQFALKAFGYLGRRMANLHPDTPDVSLLAGRKSENPWVLSARKIIHTATPTYFELQKNRIKWSANSSDRCEMPTGEYILFIDDCLALSFDFQLGHFAQIIETKSYFELLNGFFDQLEHMTGLPVVIAGHPNGLEYPGYAAFFNGRSFYNGRTALLSCGCVCALTHYSSAINFPVILRKPLALLTFDLLKTAPQGRVLEAIASALHRPILNLSQKFEESSTLKGLLVPAKEAAYASFEADYIVNTSEPGSNPFENLAVYLSSLPAATHLPL
jgi:hypothetical protein